MKGNNGQTACFYMHMHILFVYSGNLHSNLTNFCYTTIRVATFTDVNRFSPGKEKAWEGPRVGRRMGGRGEEVYRIMGQVKVPTLKRGE